MRSTADLLTDTQLSERLSKVAEGLPDAAVVMVVEWRSRADVLRRHANVFLGFIVLALIAGRLLRVSDWHERSVDNRLQESVNEIDRKDAGVSTRPLKEMMF